MSETAFPAFLSARRLPNLFDLVAGTLILAGLIYVASVARGTLAPLDNPDAVAISLDPMNLPEYAIRTTLRMFAALMCSLFFTLTYATWAAKSRGGPASSSSRCSTSCSPCRSSVSSRSRSCSSSTCSRARCWGRSLPPSSQSSPARPGTWRSACIQSLKTVPADLDEASRSLKLSECLAAVLAA